MTTKDKILRAVMTIFLKDGNEGLTMRRIAEEAGIGKSTVYEYFDSKEIMVAEAFLFAANGFLDKIHEGFNGMSHMPFEQVMRISIEGILTTFQNEITNFMKAFEGNSIMGPNGVMKQLYKDELIDLQLKGINYTEVFLKKGQEEGIIRDDLLPIDVVNFQRIFVLLCAGFCSKDGMVTSYSESVEDPVNYVYDALMRMYGR